ncbi:MAG: type II toxin-antitoxin system ParD family antitoxin [Planctomycetota bacterium]
MNVNLTPELEDLVRRKVEAGLYNNQSEVIREALRLLAEQDRLREAHMDGLQRALAEGLAQADRGELRDGAEVMAELRAMLKRRRKGAK